MAIVSHPSNKNYRDRFEEIFGKKKPVDGDIPRRNRLDQMTPAELACRNAVAAIETVGCDDRLTRAQILIQQAQALVADYVDSHL